MFSIGIHCTIRGVSIKCRSRPPRPRAYETKRLVTHFKSDARSSLLIPKTNDEQIIILTHVSSEPEVRSGQSTGDTSNLPIIASNYVILLWSFYRFAFFKNRCTWIFWTAVYKDLRCCNVRSRPTRTLSLLLLLVLASARFVCLDSYREIKICRPRLNAEKVNYGFIILESIILCTKNCLTSTTPPITV